MSAVSLSATLARASKQIGILEDYYKDSSVLEPRYQYLIAEVVTLRLFAIFEDSIAELACKLARGARYLSGKRPCLFVNSRSLAAAQNNLANYNRKKGIQLRWSKSKYIKEAVRYVFNPAEPFINIATINANDIDEMRIVRNHIAHKNESTKKKFKQVLRARYGSALKISAGSFLVSTSRAPTPIVQEYLVKTRIILNDFAQG